MSRSVLAASLAVLAMACPAVAQSEKAGPSPAVIAMRWQLLNPEVNSFTFRDTDKVFESRPVKRGGPVWDLPSGAALTLPHIDVGGQSHDYERFAEDTFTNALLVIRDGRIVFEDYRNRSDETTPFISFSMAKTFTAMLVGLALDKGEIGSLDDLAVKYVPQLKGGGYDGVTIRQLLQMRSGSDIDERYDFGENPSLAGRIHESAIIRNERRFADFAIDVGRRSEPGSTFNYATLDTAVLGWVLEEAVGQKLEQQMQERIWAPLGAERDGFWIADGPPGRGRALNGMGFNATLRDFGRLGQLLLDGGRRGQTRVLPEGWVTQMSTMLPVPIRGPQAQPPGYGFQTWQVDEEPGAFAALGLAGQMIYVHPKSRTVIVKLSFLPPNPPPDEFAQTVAMLKAITSTQN
ncbi:beta-lactamase family protein [Croceibacterium sp. LX-88]|uniref:Beta-lactamase family protein n=1 Tax=Croceibacterium selenioxidans TaxID=2838833 RepID=A0ABS5W6G6_9SPHN|nr:serine hydrolase [Croceibacterium selenioxidans]MBT2134908.1 beta-lactamase family protein [Croceibacterium selenioxidans]